MTTRQLLEQLDYSLNISRISIALRRMPDVYVDRWVRPEYAPQVFASVWCAVKVPENCPHPKKEPVRN